MPKNKGKGGKNRKKGKNANDVEERELIFKEDGQEYGVVTRILGGSHVEALCMDGKRRLCHIRGKMHKKVWLGVGDLVLLGLRDYQDSRADVILKYTALEAANLKTYGELPDTVRVPDVTRQFEDEDDAVQFLDKHSDLEDELIAEIEDLSLA